MQHTALLVPGTEDDAVRCYSIDTECMYGRPVGVTVDQELGAMPSESIRYGRRIDIHDGGRFAGICGHAPATGIRCDSMAYPGR